MNSVFEKGSTVFNAIEKAWIVAGRPESFSIKVIDEGKRGIFGFLGRDAIISISYKPKKIIEKQKTSRESKKTVFSKKTEISKKQYQNLNTKNIEKSDSRLARSAKPQSFGWDKDLSSEIIFDFENSIKIMNIKIPFDFNINKKILNINFQKNIFDSKDDEKSFFISLSYLLMHILKKKHKKKFDNFHVIINSPLTKNDANK